MFGFLLDSLVLYVVGLVVVVGLGLPCSGGYAVG